MTLRSLSRALSDGTALEFGYRHLRLRHDGRARHRLDGNFDGLSVTGAAEEGRKRDGHDNRKRDECRDKPAAANNAPPSCPALDAWV